MIQTLRSKNSVPVYEVGGSKFRNYGRIIEGYDFSGMIQFLEERTEIPKDGNVYVASVPELEEMEAAVSVRRALYGGMPIQVGYCNGQNTTYNGFEYHKGSEINIAVTDFMLVLGHIWDIHRNSYHVKQAEVFLVKAGMAVEMYQTTLHLSPCRVSDSGFRDIVILPRGTNTPLECGPSGLIEESHDKESALLLRKNKWVIAHPDREPLIKQGAFPGVQGDNIQLHY